MKAPREGLGKDSSHYTDVTEGREEVPTRWEEAPTRWEEACRGLSGAASQEGAWMGVHVSDNILCLFGLPRF